MVGGGFQPAHFLGCAVMDFCMESQLLAELSTKAYGNVYVDDAAFGCPLMHPKGFARPCVDWEKVGPQLEKMCFSRR